eukprot:496265_1
MRSSETLTQLKIQQELIDQYNEVKDDISISQRDDISRSHHADNTMLIHENIEFAPRKDTSLHLKQFNELLKNYQNAMDSLNNPPKKSSTLDTPVKPIKVKKPSDCKCNCINGLLWILLLYSVLCSSYFIYCIFFHSSNFLFFFPSNAPTIISNSTIFEPRTLYPTQIAMEPTLEPTLEPTIEPTLDIQSMYNSNTWSVGDYKISTQIQNHGKWLLCDGKLYKISNYNYLFDIIGYTFTNKNIYDNDKTVFAVPDVRDKNIGIYGGTKHSLGDIISNGVINSTFSFSSYKQTIFIGNVFIYSSFK